MYVKGSWTYAGGSGARIAEADQVWMLISKTTPEEEHNQCFLPTRCRPSAWLVSSLTSAVLPTPMDFDDLVTEHVGAFGRGQLIVLLASSVGWATLAVAVLSMVFVTQTPAWSCTSADDAICQQQYQLQQHDPTAICKLHAGQYSFDNPESSLISTFGLVCGDSYKTGWANAVFFIGYALGSFVFGWLADAHGRRVALLASSASTACVTLSCAASSSYGWFIAGKILQGICASGLPIAAYVLATESVGPQYRGRAGTFSQLIYHLGEWFLAPTAYALQNWRLLYVATAACCVLTAGLAVLVPESPRWQLLHGRHAEAVRTLKWLARMNGRQLPQDVADQLLLELQVQDSLQDGDDKLALITAAAEAAAGAEVTGKAAAGVMTGRSGSVDGDGAGGVCDDNELLLQDGEDAALLCRVQKLPVLKGVEHDTPLQQQQQGQQGQQACNAGARHQGDSVFKIFTDPLLARLFWVSAWLCTVMAVAFFTANLATEKLQGSLYVNFIVTSLGELPATIIGAIAVDAIGRRPTINTGLLVTGIACCVCSLLKPGAWSTALASLGKAGCSSTWSLAYIYAAELMPTSVRSAALAGSNQAARLGGVIAPFIVYAGDKLGHPKMPFALIGVLSTLTAVMTALLPETRGKGQPDTMADLREMYGSSNSSSSSNGGSNGSSQASNGGSRDVPRCLKKHASGIDRQGGADVGIGGDGLLPGQGSGLLHRLLSRASSGGSWVVGAVRSGSFAGSLSRQRQWQPVLHREGSELQAIVTDASKPNATMG